MANKIYEILKKIIAYFKRNLGFYLGLIIILLLWTIELPFVVYKPGGLVNLNERIVYDNNNIKGSFSMCYVSVMRGTIPVLALSYLFPNWDIKPQSEVTSENQSLDELFALEKIYYDSSIDNATILAFQKAGKKITITKNNLYVVYLADEAQTDIKIGDKILKVEGQEITNLEELKTIINNYQEGDSIKIEVERDDKIINTTSKIYATTDGLKVGISTLLTYDYETDEALEVKTKASESGSSGGLMLTLAIYNKLTDADLTKGKKIVGTGTIDINGKVGEIDGVKYKLLGAEANKAEIFLCPKENYDEALKVKQENNLKIKIKAVATFDEALVYLTSLES